MTKSKSHWFRIVYFQVQDKKLKFEIKKMSYNLFVRLVLNRSKVAYQQKISKRKKLIT